MSSSPFELNHSLVRAGAGAGKTRGLVDRVVEVYRGFSARPEKSAPRIVLTTFTRKATQELKERLILRACSEKDAGLLRYVSDPTLLHISTIHGLLSMFLKQMGHLAGLDSGFQIITEAQSEHLARLALRETLVEHPEHLPWLETYGFTRVLKMCRRYQELRREQGGVRPAQLRDLEQAAKTETVYWKKQFTHLIHEIEAATDEPSWRQYAGELKSFLRTWSESSATLEGLPSKPRRSKKQVDFEHLHEPAENLTKEFREELRRPCWNRALWKPFVNEWTLFAQLGDEFARRLTAIKEAQARFEMNDLELKSLEILRAHPFLGSVFSEAWDYFMVDEYQDTSPLQVEILAALMGDRAKYLVGDPQQSIYLFRGAEVGVFQEAELKIQEGGGEVHELRKNYRSSPSLLLWINEFMKSLSPQFKAMTTRDESEVSPAQGQIVLWRAPDDASELQGLVARVGQLLQEGARLEQICVLARTHRNLMEVSRVLRAYGYPTHVHASRGFNQRREVLDAQALWKFMLNPHDNLNLMLLLRSPWFFIDDWQLSEWMKDRPPSLWRRLLHLAENERPEALQRLLQLREQLGQEGMVRTFEKALCENAFLDLSLANDPAGRKETNLWKLIQRAQNPEDETDDALEANEGDATSAQEPNSINLMTIHGAKGLEFDHVLLPRMGESPRTSATPPIQAEEGRFFFPTWAEEEGEFISSPLDLLAVRRMRRRELEEFDRWLYVAVTRAKESLTLSWSGRGRESWVQRSSWFLQPKGKIQTPQYTVDVVEEMPQPEYYQSTQASESLPREPFSRQTHVEKSEHQSVTALVEREVKIKAGTSDLLRRAEAQALGIRIHRALESLKYHEDTSSDPAIRYVLDLKDPPLREFIKNGRVEWGFHVQVGQGKNQRVIEGQIDLWAKHGGKLYVVDYKSGSPAFAEAAFRQLSLYTWALRKFGHYESAELLVVYPLLKKIERRAFDEKLLLHWENEIGGAKTRSQSDFAGSIL